MTINRRDFNKAAILGAFFSALPFSEEVKAKDSDYKYGKIKLKTNIENASYQELFNHRNQPYRRYTSFPGVFSVNASRLNKGENLVETYEWYHLFNNDKYRDMLIKNHHLFKDERSWFKFIYHEYNKLKHDLKTPTVIYDNIEFRLGNVSIKSYKYEIILENGTHVEPC